VNGSLGVKTRGAILLIRLYRTTNLRHKARRIRPHGALGFVDGFAAPCGEPSAPPVKSRPPGSQTWGASCFTTIETIRTRVIVYLLPGIESRIRAILPRILGWHIR